MVVLMGKLTLHRFKYIHCKKTHKMKIEIHSGVVDSPVAPLPPTHTFMLSHVYLHSSFTHLESQKAPQAQTTANPKPSKQQTCAHSSAQDYFDTPREGRHSQSKFSSSIGVRWRTYKSRQMKAT